MIIAAMAAFAAAAFAGTPAAYPGGAEAMQKYIVGNMKYPAQAKDNGIEGDVPVAFTVKPDGSLGTIKIVRMVDPDLETEAIRLVKGMPKWTPAKNDKGAAVESSTQITISFQLPE